MGSRRPSSLVAERAVRYLREHGRSVDSVRLAARVLATRAPDEATARKVLAAAFTGDPRLIYDRRRWRLAPPEPVGSAATAPPRDRVVLLLDGTRPGPGLPFRLGGISVLRLRGEHVVGACGGDPTSGPSGRHLRRAVRETLEDADLVAHDPPGALAAFERWLGQALPPVVSLRRLARQRLNLPARHDLEALAARLGLLQRRTGDPLEQADLVEACLSALRRPEESLRDLWLATAAGAAPVDWSRLAFDRQHIDRAPHAPGTYRFFDAAGALLYCGKSKDLHRRLQSYFREGAARPARVQALLDRLHRVEYQPSGSELEALLREAEQIRREQPRHNVQRRYHVREGRGRRLRSILILEPAEAPHVLRAYLIHEERLVARVPISAGGRGLARIERLLDDYFFFAPTGPAPVRGPDLDVEPIVRWLATHRDRVVAFDPTALPSAKEIIERLRWFLAQGGPRDPQGYPILPR